MKAVLSLVGLAIFAFWTGSLVREFSMALPDVLRRPAPAAVTNPGRELSGWVDVPRPMIVIRPEIVVEPAPIPVTPQPAPTPTPPPPELSVFQIFAKLDRGEITAAETKALLAAKRSSSQ